MEECQKVGDLILSQSLVTPFQYSKKEVFPDGYTTAHTDIARQKVP